MSNLLSYFISQRLKIVKLPIECKIRFIQDKDIIQTLLFQKNINNGYVDKFKNE